MIEHRIHNRIDYDEKCLLQIRNEYFPAQVKNISRGGAFVVSYNTLIGLNVGDSCNVSVNGDPPNAYPCKVVRVEAFSIALEFTDSRTLMQ